MKDERIIWVALAGLVLFDAALVVWAFGLPELWFELFHRSLKPTPGADLFLKRCGANWAAFMVFQGLALARWKARPHWLGVVAGLRLGDIFTDVAYVSFAPDPTWLAWVSLPLAGVVNLVLGLFFLGAFIRRTGGGSPAGAGG